MKLYMIRHGESTANDEKKHAGWGQVPLTEKGREDAKKAGALLEGIAFDRIYVSDLIRAQETMELALPGAEGIVTPLLREIGVGELSGQRITDCTEKYGESYLANKAVYNFAPYGGEDHDMHQARIRYFADQVAKSEEGTVAAFCHAGSVRCMLEVVLDRWCSPKDYPIYNGSVSIFEYADGKWTCLEWNKTEKE